MFRLPLSSQYKQAQGRGLSLGESVLTCGAAGGLIQLLAGMWEMWKANTFAATAFSSYGGFWMGYALYNILKAVRALPEIDQRAGRNPFMASRARALVHAGSASCLDAACSAQKAR